MKKVLPILWLGLILAFIYLPILILAVYSVTDATIVGSKISGLTLRNYFELFGNAELREMIAGTFGLAFGAAALATVLGTLGAIGAHYSKRIPKAILGGLNQIPVVNADIVTAFALCVLLIVFFGIDKDTFLPLVLGHVVLCAPFVYLSVTPRLKQTDNSLYEAALDLGATPAQALFRVVLPQLFPSILSGFMLAFTLSLDDYFITTYTKPSTFDTISTYVVNATKGSQTDIKTALWALSTVIFLVVVLIVVGMNLSGKRNKEAK